MALGTTETDTPDDLRQAYHSAIKMLSAREHSSFELTHKLNQRGYSGNTIEQLLEDLQNDGYQSDDRFAEQYARQRLNKGYGPLSIKAKLHERGIGSDLASAALAALEVVWQAHAMEVIGRKFSDEDIVSTESKIESRIARFLQSRGFSATVALRALKECRQNV